MVAPLDGRLLPRPDLSRLGLIAFWDDERALDAFLASHPLAARLASGWHVRMRPLRAVGSWAALPDLPTATPAENTGPTPAESTGQPVAAITLGRLRLRRLSRFLQANAPAAGQAAAEPGLMLAHGLAAPPRLVATFSLWENAAAMSAYAQGRSGAASHLAAVRAHHSKPFHHESIFIRLHPYAQHKLPATTPIPATGM